MLADQDSEEPKKVPDHASDVHQEDRELDLKGLGPMLGFPYRSWQGQ